MSSMWQSRKERYNSPMSYSIKIEFVENSDTQCIHFLRSDCFYTDEFEKKLNLSNKKQEINFNELFTTLEQTPENWLKSADTKFVSEEYYNNQYCNELLNMTPYFTSRDAKTSDEPKTDNIIGLNFNLTLALKYATVEMPIFETVTLIETLKRLELINDNRINTYIKPELRDGVKCYICAN